VNYVDLSCDLCRVLRESAEQVVHPVASHQIKL
jgi:hypothetical protein